MKQSVTSDGDQRPRSHEDDWRREQYDALARCDISEDDSRNVLIDIDDDGATRIVVNNEVILDEITNRRRHLSQLNAQYAETKAEVLRRLTERSLISQDDAQYIRAEIDRLTRENKEIAEEMAEEMAEELDRMLHPPAKGLQDWLRGWVSAKSFERIYSQIFLDMREEHAEALARGTELKARVVIVRCCWSIVWALLTELRFVGAVIRALRGS